MTLRAIEWAATVGDDIDQEASYPMHTNGTASTLPVDEPADPAARLREALREIGVDIPPEAARQRIGFLP
jgi:hypothetical protein